MKEINYKEMKFNPFNLIGGEWMLVTAGNEQSGCNTMTASWGHLGCLWGHNDPTAVIYLRPSRYTKKFVDEELEDQRDRSLIHLKIKDLSHDCEPRKNSIQQQPLPQSLPTRPSAES